MAKQSESDCSCVIDTSGLHELATASANLKATLIARLEDGTIGVPSWAWQEFKKLYEEEAAELAEHIVKRIQFSPHVTRSRRSDHRRAASGIFARAPMTVTSSATPRRSR